MTGGAGSADPRKSAFAPVYREDARVLILGSLPGEASLAAHRYYAHPQNRFWHLVGSAIEDEQLPALAYEERLGRLLDARVALWDAIGSARRTGSLDAALRDAEPAPLRDLVACLPDLRAVAFNGAKAAQVGRSQLADAGLALLDLPSSSPAHAAMSLATKREKWAILRDYLS